ncbi:hypothetical protein CYMTET_40640 [Cymbomonas tetramitiformis]|uniref:Uncharacterized protein n=1 Tax=Cymbomonas tetramitiformis TaxID=36881 RepID=A0AAE0C9Q3_9CHLO|nr:hypothetical protein CYMTET_40640 [Cymbomonas tetramitiformis]
MTSQQIDLLKRAEAFLETRESAAQAEVRIAKARTKQATVDAQVAAHKKLLQEQENAILEIKQILQKTQEEAAHAATKLQTEKAKSELKDFWDLI